MYAVVDIAGQQVKVEENATYYVPKLDADVNKAVTFDNVLLYSDGKSTSIGTPSVKGIKVKAKVIEHLKDDKVIVFKKKRRKSYKVKNGHKQQLSKIEITKISMTKSSSKTKAKAEKTEDKKEESK
jgi:large subunit ribosomal protein L21